MKFILFAFLCFGMTSAKSLATGLLDVAGVIGVLPALYDVVNGLNNVRGTVLKLTGVINAPGNSSAALLSLTNGFIGSIAVFQQFAAANTDLAEALVAITDKSVLSLNLLQLGGGDLASKEKALSSVFSNLTKALSSIESNITKKIGVSTSTPGDLTGLVNGLKNVISAKQGLIAAVNNVSGLTGATFGIALTLVGVTQGLKDCSNAFAGLAAALLSKAKSLPGVDFIGIIVGLNDLSKAEGDLANAILALTNLSSILRGLEKGFL